MIQKMAKNVHDNLAVGGIYSQREIGKILQALLGKKPFDMIRIADWAGKFNIKHHAELADDLVALLQSLEIMEQGAEFEYTQKELQDIADALLIFKWDPRKGLKR